MNTIIFEEWIAGYIIQGEGVFRRGTNGNVWERQVAPNCWVPATETEICEAWWRQIEKDSGTIKKGRSLDRKRRSKPSEEGSTPSVPAKD